MKRHYTTVDDAQAAVAPFLRDWELIVALQRGSKVLWFVFERADLSTATLTRKDKTMAAAYAIALITWREYPAPATRFTASPDVETLWHRYEGYKQGREPLLAMASGCVAFLTAKSRGREGVKKTYAIELQVLRTLDNFAANLGDEHTARKFHVKSTYRSPTPQEVKWIDAAIRMIIRRVGEYAADPTASWPMLSMRDLPPL